MSGADFGNLQNDKSQRRAIKALLDGSGADLTLKQDIVIPADALGSGSPETTVTDAIVAATALQPDRIRPLNNLSGVVGVEEENARKKVLLIGDSLTKGAGGSAYWDYFAPAMRHAFGDGGTGFVPFVNGAAGLPDLSFGKSAGVAYMSGLGTASAPDKYALNGVGLHAAAGSGSDFFHWNPVRNWTSVVIYYLLQPGGGTFAWRFSSNSVDTKTTIDTSGTLGIGTIAIDADYNTNGDLYFSEITGDVVIFGGDYILSSGVAISNLGIGGSKLQQWAALDSTFRRAWFTALAPDLIIFNLGMNDRLTRTGTQYQADLDTFFDDLTAASPSTAVILVRPNAPVDEASSYLADYEAALKSTAAARRYAYVSDKAVLGAYSEADAAGLMEDGIHPSAAGNKIRAQSYLSCLGVPVMVPPYTVAAYQQVGADGPAAYVGSLSTQYLGTITKGDTAQLYSLGLKNPNRTIVVRLLVTLKRSASSASTHREVFFVVDGNTTNNQADVVSPSSPTGTLLIKTLGGDSQDQDLTFSASISGNRAVITATVTGGSSVTGGELLVSGDYRVLSDLTGITGQIVYES